MTAPRVIASVTKRERLYPEIKRMREVEGLMWREIGERLGIALKTAHEYYSDPDGSKTRERKMRNARQCLDCGATINTDGRVTNVAVRCVPCNGERERAMSRAWVLTSMQEWHERFGQPPTATDWNPSLARAQGALRHLERYESTGRPWPSVHLVQNNFGSWNAGLQAAGFDTLRSGQHRCDVPAEVITEAVAMYRDGYSLNEVAAEYGVTGTAVRYWLRRRGVAARTPWETRQLAQVRAAA